MAEERRISLCQLGELAEKDPSIDAEIDSRILEIARSNDDIILESRLSAYLLTRNSIPAFRIFIGASPEVRMSRIGIREGQSLGEAIKETTERQVSEAKRYMMYYGIDINDMSVYDLVLNTDNLDPDDVLDVIIKAIEGRSC